MDLPPLGFNWETREPPLAPVALLTRGDVARCLVDRLLLCSDPELARLGGVASQDLVVVAGEVKDLPWVDGAAWLGIDPAAPALRVPTTCLPNVPLDLIEQAALRRVEPPIVLVPGCLVSLAALRPLVRPALIRWRESAHGQAVT